MSGKCGISNLRKVQEFWNAEACGSHFVPEFREKREFFLDYMEFRYRTEWHIPLMIPFSDFKGKNVLEIGCGNGADAVMFVNNGATYTGVDLTKAAVCATREHLDLFGLEGSCHLDNAENLGFAEESFDLVYSYGVLHHSPEPWKAFSEVYRVLKPGGKAILMLYNKHSLNYCLRIMTYMRLRLLITIFFRSTRRKGSIENYRNAPNCHLRDNRDRRIWDTHYQNYVKQGWSYLKASNFVHRCTDGPGNPFAYVFCKSDVRKMLSLFKQIDIKVAHFPLRKNRLARWIPLSLEKLIASIIGWHLIIYATK